MLPTNTIPENPFVSIQNKTVTINTHNKKYNLSIDNIQKIYLTKCKVGYWFTFLEEALFIHNPMFYNVNIETKDFCKISFKINPLERFFYIRMIYLVRHSSFNNVSKVTPLEKLYPMLSVVV